MYFSDEANSKLSTITKLKDGIGKEHEDYLVNLKKQIDNFISKLEKIKTLSGFQFEEGEKVSEKRKPKDQNGQYPEMDKNNFQMGCSDIKIKLPGFAYERVLERLKDNDELRALYEGAQNGYEILQVFRLFDIEHPNSVIRKFINETYHIENEFICQLDHLQFDTIPEYVIQECHKVFEEMV